MICFKYRSGAAALRCLAEGSLYFSEPAKLNDTLEAKYEHASPEEFNRVMTQCYSEVSKQRGGTAFKFDPDGISEMAAANAAENKHLQNFTEQVGIFSAARRANDQAMWAYYADDSHGVCFELEWTIATMDSYQLWPVDVTYDSSARIHNRAEDWRTVFLELASQNPNASLEKLHQLSLEEVPRRKWGINTATRAAGIKHTDWEHEKEIRLLAPKFGALPVLADVLKRVHFVRTDNEHWASIMRLLFQLYPQVETVHWQFSHGALSAIPTPMETRLVLV